MRTQSSTITVADYCQGLERKEYTINRHYQRSDTVWPEAARSFLIETILLDFPIPKLSLHQRLDLPTRRVVKEIVDGQQRSRAILDFYQNKLRLSRTMLSEDFAGRTFNELDDSFQAQFLNYGLNFDLFVGATSEEVREVFRRMNSFTVPLNPEEARHANYQGPFKWFIHQLSRDYDAAFRNAGVFTEKQINRMVDAKLLTEISSALLTGISTTSKTTLNRVYRENDVDFERRGEIEEAIRYGLDAILGNGDFRSTPLMKPYNFYSLCLAFIQEAGKILVVENPNLPSVPEFRPNEPDYNLTLLAGVVSDAEADESRPAQTPFKEFVAATKDRTNVADQRRRRFEFFLAALLV